MNGVLSSTNVRKEFGKFIDTVIHERPTVVKRNRDQFLALSIVQTKVLLESRVQSKSNFSTIYRFITFH